MERRLEAIEEPAVARNRPRIDERHEELGVVDFEPSELVDLAHLVADDEAEIPERVQDRAQGLSSASPRRPPKSTSRSMSEWSESWRRP